MKKSWILVTTAVLMLGGCSWFSWLNPLSDEAAKESAVFEPNPFLWQAAKDKIAFMTIASEDKESGTLVTEWHKSPSAVNEEFKIEAKVLSTKLRSDCLQVTVYKRIWNGSSWVEADNNKVLDQEVETAILKKARDLYRQSLNLE